MNRLGTVAGNNQIFYAATEWGGLYKTIDQGHNWFRLDKHLPVATFDVKVDPSNPNRVYATSFFDGRAVNSVSGIEVSTDGGASWVNPLSAHPQATFNASAARRSETSAFGIGIRPDAPQNVYIGTDTGLAISNDSGATWRFVDPTPATPATNVWGVVVQAGGPTNQGIIDIIGDNGHLRSTDGGSTWTADPAGNGLPTGYGSIAVSPAESYVLFVMASDQNLYESDNAGTSWTNKGSLGNSRGQFVETNQRSPSGGNNRFDVWVGGVGVFRAAGITPPIPAPGGANRIPNGTAAWTNVGSGAHSDSGDVVFDTTAANDAVPLIFSSDGGVFRNTGSSADSASWVQPDVTPQALWVYGMAGAHVAGTDPEDLYFGVEDNGTWASTNAGAATPTWSNKECCDSFNMIADTNRVVYDTFSAYNLFVRNPGMTGGGNVGTNPPGAGSQGYGNFNFIDNMDEFGDKQYVATTPSGVFITTDITAGAVTWTQIGAATTPAGGFVAIRASVSGGTPTFYAVTTTPGVFEGQAAAQLWKFTGTTPSSSWTRIDTNGLTGVGIYAVDPSNPNRLYASDLTATGPRMVRSNDGGTTWQPDPGLDTLMTGEGFFKYQNQLGPTSYITFNSYAQPSLLAFDPQNVNTIVAGGRDSGVFLSTDNGQTWRLLSDPIDSGNSGVANVPRPWFAYFDHDFTPTRIYIGTQGRGIFRIDPNFSLPPDRFEPNNTVPTATSLGSQPSINLTGLTIDNPADVDFFKYTASDTGKLIVATSFNNLTGHLDLRVRDRFGNVIANGTLSNVAPGGSDKEQLIIPVVAGQNYFVEVFSGVGHTNTYSLEIEDFAAPVPRAPVLNPADDTGRSNLDNVTFRTTPTITVQADLTDFANMGISILTAAQANGSVTPGAAVQIFVGGVAKGFASAVGSSTTQFQFTFSSGSAGLDGDGLKFITAAVKIFDGQKDNSGNPAPAMGRTQVSEPLLLTLDTMPPAPPSTPAPLPSSISGSMNNTNINAPAFQGTGEANALIRILAQLGSPPSGPTFVIGQGVIGSDLTDGVPNNGLGAWEVTVEPLADGVYTITAVAEDLAGNISAPSGAPTMPLVIDTKAPERPTIDLTDASDSGRNNQDNITRFTTLTFSVTAEPNSTVIIKDGNTVIDTFTMPNAASTLRTIDFTTLPGGLVAEGQHPLSAEATDKAGNRSAQSQELDVTIDTTPPPAPTILIDPKENDSGVQGSPATLIDRITNATATGFAGTAEADAIVRLTANGFADGLTVALPSDGNRADPTGQWRLAGLLDLNNPSFFPLDGLRTMSVTAEDVAGNVSAATTLPIFIDTQGPRVTNVQITGSSTYNLFEHKPNVSRPTPLVNGLTISFSDAPTRVAGFLENALNPGVASQAGQYVVKGDRVGIVAVTNVVVNNVVTVGSLATATVQLSFAAPLPDDRYTLTVADALVDDAGNRLDGENNAQQPLDMPTFPSGDGQPGGNFVARFTVDSRPEVGTYSNGTVFIDINGDGIFDPEGSTNDRTNRDLAFTFGNNMDQIFAGNFAPPGATSANGFDKLAAYGHANGSTGPFRFLIDFTGAGVPNLNVESLVNGNGQTPIAGHFNPALPGDQIGLFDGSKWTLDTDGNYVLGDAGDTVIQGNLRGQPIVGDFDGDGTVDLATYKNGEFDFDLSSLDPGGVLTGNVNATLHFGPFSNFDVPVAKDMNQDGVTDIGLYIPERNGPPPTEQGLWYFLVSTGTPVPGTVNTLDHPFKPEPFGNDQFVQFGDVLAKPVLGNFDPPLSPPPTVPDFVSQVYQDVLHRPGDLHGLIGWNNALAQGASRTDVGLAILNSAEGQADAVQALYGSLLHRVADPTGLSGFTAFLAAGGALEQVESIILSSPEYYQTRGGGSDAEFLNAVYLDVLNRSVDAGGMAGWSSALAQGVSRAHITDAILQSDEYRLDLVQSYYHRFLGREADGGGLAAFLAALAHGKRDEEIMAIFLGSDEYYARLTH